MAEFVTSESVRLNVAASNVDEALHYLSDCARELGYSEDVQAVYEAFCAREAEGTTGMMDGFAIPHAKSEAIDTAGVVVVKFAGDVEWESMDDQPIKAAIALYVPAGEAGTTHLKLLSRIAVMLMDEDFRAQILASEDTCAIAQEINSRLDN